MLAVVQPDADDLLRVRDRRQQLDRGERMRRRSGVAEPSPQVVDPPGGDQLPQAPPMRLAQQRPGIDDPLVLEQARPGPVAGVVGEQPHGPRYWRAKVASTVARTIDSPGFTGGGVAQALAPAFPRRVPVLPCGAAVTHLLTGSAAAASS